MFKNKRPLFSLCSVILVVFSISSPIVSAKSALGGEENGVRAAGLLVRKEERKPVVYTEHGEISAVRIGGGGGINGSYLLHFFTLQPNALLLPVVLHADMVFYVHTGGGKLSWTEEDDLKRAGIQRGDVYRLQQGTVFFIHNNLEAAEMLRIHAIFASSDDDLREPTTGPYSSIQDTVLGFGSKILQATFQAPVEVINELLGGTRPPAIVHAGTERDIEARSTESRRSYGIFELNKKKKKKDKYKKKGNAKLFNLFEEEKGIKNCNGWSTMVTAKKKSALKGSNIGLFMVNLTTGSMMAPHWDPIATEISIVLQGRGMVRASTSDISNDHEPCSVISNDHTACRNMRFEVREGDVFALPKFHPAAQMSFNNDTFVFMGFTTTTKKTHPQFLAGEYSFLQALDKDVLSMSFNVTRATLDQLLAPKKQWVILRCTSCAEDEFITMEEEIETETGTKTRKKRSKAVARRENEVKIMMMKDGE